MHPPPPKHNRAFSFVCKRSTHTRTARASLRVLPQLTDSPNNIPASPHFAPFPPNHNPDGVGGEGTYGASLNRT